MKVDSEARRGKFFFDLKVVVSGILDTTIWRNGGCILLNINPKTEVVVMLILSRKSGEKLYIDETIEVTVVKLSGNRVSLGIKAPRDVKVLRGELFEQWAMSEEKSQPVKSEHTLAPVELIPASREPFLTWSI